MGEFAPACQALSVDIDVFSRKLSYELLEFLEKYENEDGLLERLEQWNFVEWSDANLWVMDVNYPTNMLYYL